MTEPEVYDKAMNDEVMQPVWWQQTEEGRCWAEYAYILFLKSDDNKNRDEVSYWRDTEEGQLKALEAELACDQAIRKSKENENRIGRERGVFTD